MKQSRRGELYGMAAEFESAEELRAAAVRLFNGRYKRVRFYTPYPVEGLAGMFRSMDGWIRYLLVSPLLLGGGIFGGVLAFWMQEYANLIAFPINVGGRPLNSWPAFIPITFELTILFATFGGVIAFFLLNSLPQFYHPMFNARDFERASQDRYFLCVEVEDPRFDRQKTRALLEEANAVLVEEVPW